VRPLRSYTLQNFFGTDKIGFSAFSNKSCTTRRIERFSDALKEVIDARVWAGIHFRTADMQGAVLGNKVAHYLKKHYFQPVQGGRSISRTQGIANRRQTGAVRRPAGRSRAE
jgi:hypothetical protein